VRLKGKMAIAFVQAKRREKRIFRSARKAVGFATVKIPEVIAEQLGGTQPVGGRLLVAVTNSEARVNKVDRDTAGGGWRVEGGGWRVEGGGCGA
jgi:hypothetical protein